MRRNTYTLEGPDGTSISFDNRSCYVLTSIDTGEISNDISSYEGASQYGKTITGRRYSNRTVTLTGHILADSKEQMRARMRALQKVVAPSHGFYLVADGQWRLEVTADSTLDFAQGWYLSNNTDMAKWQITGTCANPFWQGVNDIQASLATWTRDFHFPKVNPMGQRFTFGHRLKQRIVPVMSDSDVSCGMAITMEAIDGTIVNPMLENLETGERFQLRGTIPAGDKVDITTTFGSKSVRDKEGNNWLYKVDLTSDWLQMPPGLSRFRYEYDDDSTGSLRCTIKYTPLLIEV